MQDTQDTTDLDKPDLKDEVIQIVSEYLKSSAFKNRQVTDTPTDALEIVNKKYCDSNSKTLLTVASLSSTATFLTTDTFDAKQFLSIEVFIPTPAAAIIPGLQFNGDTGANYSWQTEGIGGTTNLGGQNSSLLFKGGTITGEFVSTGIMFNGDGHVKMGNGQSVESLSSGWDWHITWTGTAQVTSITLLANNGGNTLPSGTTLAIYGHDQA